MVEVVAFYLCAAVMLASALAVIWARSPINSLLSLLLAMSTMAVLFVLLGAVFLAALQLLIYAGAVLVLFLFVLMLLNVDAQSVARSRQFTGRWLAVGLGLALLAQLLGVFGHIWSRSETSGVSDGTITTIGRALFQEYLLPFELISLLILAAIIGAVALAQRNTD